MSIKDFFKRIGSFGKKTTDVVSFVQFLENLKKERTSIYTDWVYAGFHTIAQSLARSIWKLYDMKKNGDIQEVEGENALLGLLYTFNGKTTRFDAMAKTILGFLIDGEVGWYMSGKVGNKPTEIQVIAKRNYKINLKDQFGAPSSYSIQTTTGAINATVEDFFVIKNVNPNSDSEGFAVLEALREVSDTDFYISRWNKNLMKNDATPSSVVELPVGAKFTDQEAKIFKKELESTLGGYENAHKIGILYNGAKFNNTSVSPKDLDFVNGRGFNRDMLLAIIGTPKTLLGLDNGITKATAETAERVFAKYTLEPILEQVIEWLNEYLVPAFGDNLWLDFEPLASEDQEQKLNEMDKGVNRWLTINDAREMSGREPINGGDSIYMPLINMPVAGGVKPKAGIDFIEIKAQRKKTIGDTRKVKYIKQRVSNRNSYKKLVASAIAKKTSDNISKKIDNIMGKKDLAGKVIKIGSPVEKKVCNEGCGHKHFDDVQKLFLWNSFIKLKRSVEENFALSFKDKIFKRQRQIVLENLKKQGEKGIEFKFAPKDVLFDLPEQIKTTIEIVSPQYYALATAGLEIAGEVAGEVAPSISEIPALMDWVKKVADKWSEEITNTTYTELSKVLQTGLDEGQSIYELGNNIEDYFGTVAPARADMIARTESARAMTASQAFAYEEFGFKVLEWVLLGENPCEICQANSVKDWTTEEAQKGTINYAHPNCECMFLPK